MTESDYPYGPGKGDRFRPVDKKKYGDNYDRIFGKQKKGSKKK